MNFFKLTCHGMAPRTAGELGLSVRCPKLGDISILGEPGFGGGGEPPTPMMPVSRGICPPL